MKMISKLIILLGCVLLVGCNSSLPDSGEQQGEGEPIELAFNLYSAVVSKAGENTKTVMPVGSTFRIYAFKAGEMNLSNPVATAMYTVVDTNGKSTGNLSLYRGNYDFYLISNNTNQAPSLDAGVNYVTVDNGNDFMYNTITNEVIQPESPGQNTMTVTLRTPFVRLGTKVDLSVKANAGSPVPVTGLAVQKITIKSLSSPLAYRLGASDWNSGSSSYNAEYSVIKFGSGQPTQPHDNTDPVVLLPVDGSVDLVFDLALNVSYMVYDAEGTGTQTSRIFNYQASAAKALLKGMKYKFEFTLTFFGILTPGDMTVSLLEYTEEDLSTDDVGK